MNLSTFLEHEILPRLTPELVYDHPAHQWRSQGRTKWAGGCPRHESKSRTAFVVDPRACTWFCHGCKVGGGPLQFRYWARTGSAQPRGEDFVQVLRELAELAGVPFPERELSPEEQAELRAAEERRASLEAVVHNLQRFLWLTHDDDGESSSSPPTSTPPGVPAQLRAELADEAQAARAYLHQRGFNDDGLRALGVGFFPLRADGLGALPSSLRDVARQAGVGALRGYLTFPWRDASGHMLTIYGRWPGTPPEGKKKTRALHGEGTKRSPLYFDRARHAGHKKLLLVEGVIDAALLQAAGHAEVVACVAASLSNDQIETLKRHRVQQVTIALDADAGGDGGIPSCVRRLEQTGIASYVSPRLPDGMDPADFVVAHSPRAFMDLALAPVSSGPVFLADRALRGVTPQSPEPQREAAIEKVQELVKVLRPGRGDRIRDTILKRLGAATGYRRETLAGSLPKPTQLDPEAKAAKPKGKVQPLRVAYPYKVYPGHHLVWTRSVERKGGVEEVEEPLANFTAEIKREILEDDGLGEPKTFLEIEGHAGSRHRTFLLPSDQFEAMNWGVKCLGPSARREPGASVKDRIRDAIQVLSGDPPTVRVYTHTGWRQLDEHGPVYLHAGGAISASGSVPEVRVRLEGGLERFVLPDPPVGDELVAAVRASLRLLRCGIAPAHVMFPLYANMVRAPLGSVDLVAWLEGQTGAQKSELSALAQQHYGKGMDRKNLPANWTSTANALPELAFRIKDALLVVDDFKTDGTTQDQGLYAKAERLIRAVGNSGGRQRMRADGSLREEHPPRGGILSSGETLPRGHSAMGRVYVIELRRGEVNLRELSRAQRDARAGLYAQAMAGFVCWLAPRVAGLRAGLFERLGVLRDAALAELTPGHSRTPEQVANLYLGLETFLRFAREVGAVSEGEFEELESEGWGVLTATGSDQGVHHREADPVERFMSLLSTALSSGRAHVAGADGFLPENPGAWGWRNEAEGVRLSGIGGPGEELGSRRVKASWKPQGERVGWLDEDGLFLDRKAAVGVAMSLGRKLGEPLPVGGRTLTKRLAEAGHLVSTEVGGQATLTVRHTVEGRRVRGLLHLSGSVLDDAAGPPLEGERAPDGQLLTFRPE